VLLGQGQQQQQQQQAKVLLVAAVWLVQAWCLGLCLVHRQTLPLLVVQMA
jgi:hypothetical protein